MAVRGYSWWIYSIFLSTLGRKIEIPRRLWERKSEVWKLVEAKSSFLTFGCFYRYRYHILPLSFSYFNAPPTRNSASSPANDPPLGALRRKYDRKEQIGILESIHSHILGISNRSALLRPSVYTFQPKPNASNDDPPLSKGGGR